MTGNAVHDSLSQRVAGMTNIPLGKATQTNTPASVAGRRALYTPVVDFLLLGGATIFILPVAALIPESYGPRILVFLFWLSFLINQPHFMHSYQIFYRDFYNKLSGTGYARQLRMRYAFAGIVVPMIILVVFAVAYISGSSSLLAFCAYSVAFFVGWHYVKQGYGILIVDTVLNRSFFNEPEKKILRVNAYACWIYFFLLMNNLMRERDYNGFRFNLFNVPLPVVYVATAVMMITTLLAAKSFYDATRRNRGRPFPINGTTAYVVSIYVWLSIYFTSTAAAFTVIPALHSLQYLAVVWRYEKNRNESLALASGASAPADLAVKKFLRFTTAGIVLGVIVFVAVPFSLDAQILYDKGVYGARYFTFMFYVFINIHHYFLDNVMWRKDNPDVSKHLFSVH